MSVVSKKSKLEKCYTKLAGNFTTFDWGWDPVWASLERPASSVERQEIPLFFNADFKKVLK